MRKMFCFLLWNMVFDHQKIMAKEILLEMVNNLKNAFEDNIQAQAQNGWLNPQEHEPKMLYPLFMI
jgi:hypothetical protein